MSNQTKLLSETKQKQLKTAHRLAILAVRKQAFQRRIEYNATPNHCLACGSPILVSVEDLRGFVFQEAKRKKFCNRSCAAKHNMGLATSPRHKPKVRVCSLCNKNYIKPYDTGSRCPDCKNVDDISILASRTKAECLVQEVRRHARSVLFKLKPRKCEICNYTIRVDCCHIRAIKLFPASTLLSEINTPNNLVALCPNHHVELDLGILKLV